MSVPKDEIRFAIVAVDTVLFTIHDNTLFVRLIRTDRPPYISKMPALPGGLIGIHEDADTSSLRHISGKAGIKADHLYTEQLATFTRPDRDPRGRVVAIAYLALSAWETLTSDEQSDTDTAFWMPVRNATKLAYDHNEILQKALVRLASRITYTTLISKIMPREFTLTELEKAYECILGTTLDKRNFRKKLLKLDILKTLNKKRTGDRARPAELYSFKGNKTDIKELDIL